jgi:AraC-like DNA-binding protein
MASKSRSHFSHLFHAVLGMPLRDYVRTVRLERAHRLLLSTHFRLRHAGRRRDTGAR